MYREETEYASNFYEYVGMANVDDTTIIKQKLDLVPLREKAEAFRKKSLEYVPNGYELQLLEQMVITLMPYCSIYRTIKEKELFVTHYALSGIHYFKYIW